MRVAVVSLPWSLGPAKLHQPQVLYYGADWLPQRDGAKTHPPPFHVFGPCLVTRLVLFVCILSFLSTLYPGSPRILEASFAREPGRRGAALEPWTRGEGLPGDGSIRGAHDSRVRVTASISPVPSCLHSFGETSASCSRPVSHWHLSPTAVLSLVLRCFGWYTSPSPLPLSLISTSVILPRVRVLLARTHRSMSS